MEEGTSVDVEPLGGRLVIFDSRRMLHISPISPIYLPYISPISPPYLPYYRLAQDAARGEAGPRRGAVGTHGLDMTSMKTEMRPVVAQRHATGSTSQCDV